MSQDMVDVNNEEIKIIDKLINRIDEFEKNNVKLEKMYRGTKLRFIRNISMFLITVVTGCLIFRESAGFDAKINSLRSELRDEIAKNREFRVEMVHYMKLQYVYDNDGHGAEAPINRVIHKWMRNGAITMESDFHIKSNPNPLHWLDVIAYRVLDEDFDIKNMKEDDANDFMSLLSIVDFNEIHDLYRRVEMPDVHPDAYNDYDFSKSVVQTHYALSENIGGVWNVSDSERLLTPIKRILAYRKYAKSYMSGGETLDTRDYIPHDMKSE